ncbi:alpha/beta fold hydrolase [Desulfatitalea tepidiphila]|uniref:alpha/beta fold hydrolase n=1 Tax=Desulfatitalea tepidiphila TaxID=1185843 RepID=UPI0006B4EC4A|nr:alpha/beta hydrolase [Desulfatitalea tepidiphila]
MPSMKDTFDHGYAVSKDIKIHYAAKGQGKLILFLHGFPEFWAAWEHQLTTFCTKYQAVAPDLRGFNLSDKPSLPQQYHVKLLVEDIRNLVYHFGKKEMILVAHDWGGGVAWAFANRYPEMVEKLVIINSPHPGVFARELLENPAQQNASAYMNLFRSPDSEEILSRNDYQYLKDALTKGQSRWRPSDALMQDYVSAWSQPGALTGGLNYYRISPLHPPTTEAETVIIRQIAEAPRAMFEVRVPTLVIWGELDEALLPGNLEGLGLYVERLEVKRIPDGTHWVIHEQPELVNSCILSFIEEVNF